MQLRYVKAFMFHIFKTVNNKEEHHYEIIVQKLHFMQTKDDRR